MWRAIVIICLFCKKITLYRNKLKWYLWFNNNKRILTGKYKYYLTDLGFTNILSEGKKEQIGAYLENIVYNELIARGYNVNIGTLENGEIDFIATRFNEKIYIQVTYILSDETVIAREFNAYKKIEDNYPKYVFSMNKFDLSQNGIIHKNIIDWLLKKYFQNKKLFNQIIWLFSFLK